MNLPNRGTAYVNLRDVAPTADEEFTDGELVQLQIYSDETSLYGWRWKITSYCVEGPDAVASGGGATFADALKNGLVTWASWLDNEDRMNREADDAPDVSEKSSPAGW